MRTAGSRSPKKRIGRIVLLAAAMIGLLIWGAAQPPTRLEPLSFRGTLDI